MCRQSYKSGYLKPDGQIKIVEWARNFHSAGDKQLIGVDLYPRPVRMAHSNATGQGLVTNGQLGVDLIRLEAGDGFVPHTHPGDHLLIVVGGEGTITYDGLILPTRAGQVYMVEGRVPHAVGAITDHVILAVGSPHKAVDDLDRMTPVEYRAIAAELGDLHCLVCDNKASHPQILHEVGCEHCPCEQCNPIMEVIDGRT